MSDLPEIKRLFKLYVILPLSLNNFFSKNNTFSFDHILSFLKIIFSVLIIFGSVIQKKDSITIILHHYTPLHLQGRDHYCMAILFAGIRCSTFTKYSKGYLMNDQLHLQESIVKVLEIMVTMLYEEK